MNSQSCLCPLIVSLLAAGQSAHAHHSIARVYDSDRQVTVTGVVTEFRFVNPHPLLLIEVLTDSGATQTWQLEMDNRFELAGIGMSAETFMPGDRVTASGGLGRTQAHSLYLRRLERSADGLLYRQVGYRPSLDFGEG